MRYELNTLVPAGNGYQLIVAFALNAGGEIIVCAVQLSTGNIHAALLTPRHSDDNVKAVVPADRVSGAVPSISEHARRLLNLARRLKSVGRTQPSN